MRSPPLPLNQREQAELPWPESIMRQPDRFLATDRPPAPPALILRVTDRGRLQPGLAADLVLFDPDTIAAGERETLDDVPGGGTRIVQRAVGIEQVRVNGELLVDAGVQRDVQPGRVLRRS